MVEVWEAEVAPQAGVALLAEDVVVDPFPLAVLKEEEAGKFDAEVSLFSIYLFN